MTTKLISREPTNEMKAAALSSHGYYWPLILSAWELMFDATPEVNPWVSVKKRLPKKKYKNCYVALDEGRVSTAKYYGESTGFDNQYITHWWDESILPIPRPKE